MTKFLKILAIIPPIVNLLVSTVTAVVETIQKSKSAN